MTTVFACELTADGLVLRAGAGDSSVTLCTRSNAVGDLLRFDSILRCFPTSAPSRYSLLLRSAQTAQGLEPATLTASPVWVAQHITAFQVTPTPQFLDIVVNLKAGPSQELLEQSVRDIERDWLGPAGVSYRIHTTQGPGDAGRIGQSIIEDQGGREGSTRTIMVVGGDGTIHELLNGINLELAKVEVILMCVPRLSRSELTTTDRTGLLTRCTIHCSLPSLPLPHPMVPSHGFTPLCPTSSAKLPPDRSPSQQTSCPPHPPKSSPQSSPPLRCTPLSCSTRRCSEQRWGWSGSKSRRCRTLEYGGRERYDSKATCSSTTPLSQDSSLFIVRFLGLPEWGTTLSRGRSISTDLSPTSSRPSWIDSSRPLSSHPSGAPPHPAQSTSSSSVLSGTLRSEN